MIAVKNVIYIKIFEDKSIYVGMTKDFNCRMSQHKSMAKKKTNLPLYNKMNKMSHYTETIFFSELYSDLPNIEKIVIKNFRDLGFEVLNLTDGGEGTLGYTYKKTDEAKMKLSKALKGRVVSEETRKKLSMVSKGRIPSDETRKKLSESNSKNMLGKHHSEKSKRIMRDLKIGKYDGDNNPMYGKYHSEKTKNKMSKLAKNRMDIKYGEDYFKNNYVSRRSFKRACERKEWIFEDFNEIFEDVYLGKKKEKSYRYERKSGKSKSN